MLRAAKKEIFFSDVAAVLPLLLLVATLFLTETRLWNFATSAFCVSGKITSSNTVSIGKNAVVYAYDASESLIATHNGTEIKRVPTQVSSYGPLPGSLALPLSPERGLHEVTHWLGKRIDPTGFVNMGVRDINPQNGQFLSGDPFGHAGSWDLYSYALGNGVSFCDPTGRIATGFHQGAIKGDYYEASNTAQGVGKFVGQVVVGFIPWVGQAADIRDLTAAWNVGRTHGWTIGTSASLAMAGVAFIPGVGDAIKNGVKPLLRVSAPAVAKVTAKSVISNPGPNGFVLVGEGALHSTVAVRQGSMVNRVFDSGFATNLHAAQPLGRYFGEGAILPSTGGTAITSRGLNLPGIINDAQLGAVYRANTHIPVLRGPAAGGTGPELIINPSNFRHLQLQGEYVPIIP